MHLFTLRQIECKKLINFISLLLFAASPSFNGLFFVLFFFFFSALHSLPSCNREFLFLFKFLLYFFIFYIFSPTSFECVSFIMFKFDAFILDVFSFLLLFFEFFVVILCFFHSNFCLDILQIKTNVGMKEEVMVFLWAMYENGDFVIFFPFLENEIRGKK